MFGGLSDGFVKILPTVFVSLYFAQVLREPRKIAAKALEATYASLQQTELLAGVIHEQDCRAIRTACCCLNSLRIRVEARANVTERAVISRQLQLIQASVQLHPTEDLNTADTSCPSRTSAEHFDDGTGPCQEN